MYTLKHQAEKELLEIAKMHWETGNSHRFLHLKFSLLESNTEEWFEEFSTLFQTYADEHCSIYVCADNDLLILNRGFTHKKVDLILSSFDKFFPDISRSEIYKLYEIRVDWSSVKALCESKIKLAYGEIEFRSTKNKHAMASVNKDSLVSLIQKDLLESLQLRRASRKDPEIMVVEDDLFSQKLVLNALKDSYTVTVTDDGQGAIMNYVTKAPDILFLDINLPDFDGHQVLEKIFELDPDAFVVMFSGNGDRENIERAVRLGAKGFVGKPFSVEKLLGYIEKSPYIRAKKQTTENRHAVH